MAKWLAELVSVRPARRGADRVEVLDYLRAGAALAVVCSHFFLHSPNSHGRSIWTLGACGVLVFFVVSGFVIPYSMYRGGYRLGRMGRFIGKRLVRLDPPYLATIALVLALNVLSFFFSPTYSGSLGLSPERVLAHLAYANAFVGLPWLNPVFWTLAVEFQFYLLMALLFPLIVHRSQAVRLGVLAVFCLSAFVLPHKLHLPHFAFVFTLGILTFQHRVGLLSTRWFHLLLPPVVFCILRLLGPAQAASALAAALAITFVRRSPGAAVAYLSAVSYSLYLVHKPIGERVQNVAERYLHLPEVAGIVLAFAASLVAAHLMWRWVERPSLRLASRISYRPSNPADDKQTAVPRATPVPAEPLQHLHPVAPFRRPVLTSGEAQAPR